MRYPFSYNRIKDLYLFPRRCRMKLLIVLAALIMVSCVSVIVKEPKGDVSIEIIEENEL